MTLFQYSDLRAAILNYEVAKKRHRGQRKAWRQIHAINTELLREYVWGRARKRRAA